MSNMECITLVHSQVDISEHELHELPAFILEEYIRDTLSKKIAEQLLKEDLIEIRTFRNDEGGLTCKTTLKVIQE